MIASALLAAVPSLRWYLEIRTTPAGLALGLASLLSLAVLVGIPVVGVVLLLRNRQAGVAVLLTVGITSLPGVAHASLMFSAFELLDGLTLAASSALAVTAAALAWTVREPAAWSWDRRVAAPYVALAATVVVTRLATLPDLDYWWLTRTAVGMILTLLTVAVVLALAARWPRRLAGAALLTLLLPQLSGWTGQLGLALVTDIHVAWELTATGLVGLLAELALAATAVWWLTSDPVSGGKPGTRTTTPASSPP